MDTEIMLVLLAVLALSALPYALAAIAGVVSLSLAIGLCDVVSRAVRRIRDRRLA